MSIKVMGVIWDLDLPAPEKMILLALADHADHTGRNAYPGTDLLAWKTGYSERQVQRILDSLERKRLALPQGTVKGGRGKAINYRVCTDNGAKQEPFSRKKSPSKSRRKKGVNLSLFEVR